MDKCKNCGMNKRPMKFREGDDLFCSHGCLQGFWSKQAILKAEAEGRCVKCWSKHEPNEKCLAWVK